MIPEGNFLKTHWDAFCQSTGLKGFNFLINSQTLYERLIWCLAIIAAACITIADVYDTIMNYSSGATTTKLRMDYDKPFQMKFATICLSFHIDEVNSHELNEFNFESIVNSNFSAKSFIALINQLFGEMEAELEIAGFERFQSFIPNQQVNLNEDLIKTLGAYMWQSMDFKFEISEIPLPTEIRPWKVDKDQISWFGPSPLENFSILCVKFEDPINFKTRVTHMRSSFDFSKFFGDENLNFRVGLPMLFFEPDLMFSPDLENAIGNKVGQTIEASGRRLGRYKMISSSHAPCSKENSQINCRLKCAAERIFSQCGCWPLFSVFFLSNQADKNICQNLNQVNSCKSRLPSSEDVCIHKCFPPCDRQIYSFSYDNIPSGSNITQYLLSIESFIYPTLEEIRAVNARQLMAQLGGNLSLWLGASFIVLLHIVIYLLKLPYMYFHSHP